MRDPLAIGYNHCAVARKKLPGSFGEHSLIYVGQAYYQSFTTSRADAPVAAADRDVADDYT